MKIYIFLFIQLLIYHLFEGWHSLFIQKHKFCLKNIMVTYQYLIVIIFILTESAILKIFLDYSYLSNDSRLVLSCISFIGLCFRFWAIIENKNFNHYLGKPIGDKIMCTTGPYALCRHPSYLGWAIFIIFWALAAGSGLGVALCVLACRKFFKDRINEEEKLLIDVWGKKYEHYKENTPINGLEWLFIFNSKTVKNNV